MSQLITRQGEQYTLHLGTCSWGLVVVPVECMLEQALKGALDGTGSVGLPVHVCGEAEGGRQRCSIGMGSDVR